jgi:cell division protein FtsL
MGNGCDKMRSTITSITIFIIMVICIGFSVNDLKKAIYELNCSTFKIENSINSNSFEKANASLEEFKNIWNTYSHKISMFTNNNELDDINNEIDKLNEYITYKNKEQCLISINIIENILKSISELEDANIYNLF